MRYSKSLSISLLIVISFVFVISQRVLGQTHNEHVTVEGAYRPSIRNFDKISIKPETQTSAFEAPDTEIILFDRKFNVVSELESISPQRVPSMNGDKITNNFLMVGLGTRLSPIFLYKNHSKIADNTQLGVGVKHFSSWTDVKNYAPSSFMNNKFDINMINDFGNHDLKTTIDYQYDLYHYYGFKPDLFPELNFSKSDIAQTYQSVGFETQLTSSKTDLRYIQHQVGLKYNYLFDKHQSKEHEVNLDVRLASVFDWFDFGGSQTIGLDVSGNYYRNSDSIRNSNCALIGALPYLKLQGDFYQLKLGVQFSYKTDDDPKFWLYPVINGSLFVFDKKLEFYAGIEGGMKRITYSSLIDDNPFISSAILPLEFQNTVFGFEGGVRTSAIKNVDLHFGVRYDDNKLMPYFVTDSSLLLENQFVVIYDDTKEFHFLFDFIWRATQKYGVEAAFRYNQYITDQQTKAWNKPNYELKLDVYYKPVSKIKLDLMLLSYGKRFAPTYIQNQETIHTISPFYDLQFGVEYEINDNFSVFLQGTNLLNDKYELFYNYPVQGIQVFGGMKVRF